MTAAKQSVVGILLAGGRSRRYGANKLAEAKIEDTPIGLVAAANFAAVLDEVLIVVPSEAPQSFALFDGAYPLTQCERSCDGIGHSIAHGVRQTSAADAWLIGLADMPFIKPQSIRAVAERVRPQTIVRPSFNGRGGHPVGFGSSFYQALIALSGDTGAQPIVQRNSNKIETIACDDPGILLDIDRPADLVAYAKDYKPPTP